MREMSSSLFQLTKQIIIYPQSCCCCAIITLIVAWSQRKCSEWSHYLWDALLILCLHIALKMQNKSKYIEKLFWQFMLWQMVGLPYLCLFVINLNFKVFFQDFESLCAIVYIFVIMVWTHCALDKTRNYLWYLTTRCFLVSLSFFS